MRLSPETFPLVEAPELTRGPDGRHRVDYRLPIPYFRFLWALQARRRARAIEAAADAGEELPSGTPWWAPPEPQPPAATAAIASVALIALSTGFAGGTGGLLTQTLPYAGDAYHASDSELGVGLAIVRTGVLLALVVGAIADRRGRRRFVAAAAVVHCVAAALVGLAPTFEVYIAAHVALRCLDAALTITMFVLAVELVPARNRTVVVSLLALASGGGSALAVVAIPLAAAGRWGLAAAYGLQLLALPLVLRAGRRLPESGRFIRHAAERHGLMELMSTRDVRGRVALVGAAVFLSSIFFAPLTEFFNRYLDEVHGLSPGVIVLFLAATAAPAIPALLVGARLADTRGRKRIGLPLGAIGLAGYVGFLLAGPVLIWPLAAVANAAGSASGVALVVYGPEMLPTRVRAAGNNAILVLSVTGSAVGLLLAGVLGDSLGIGHGIAVLAGFPLIAGAIVALRFPETAGRELEETSGDLPPLPLVR
ncbi:MAG TPA: MFS transporter [Thermoleophilaceae bacterium]|jgi:putative MFS transporter